MRTPEDFVSFNQGNIEAMVKSSQIWAAGVQDLSKKVAASAQANFEEGMSTFKAMTSVKSVKEVMDLQSSFVRSAVEKAIAQSGQVAEAGMRLAEDTFAPLAARMSLAAVTFKAA